LPVFLHFVHRYDTPEILFLQFQKIRRPDKQALYRSRLERDLRGILRVVANESLYLLDGRKKINNR
jgi:hypothetical protein